MKNQLQVEAIIEAIIDYLKANQALDLLPEIAQKLTQQSWVKIDPNLAVVSSSVPLSSSQKQLLKKTLAQKLNRPIRLKTKIDQNIIAGLKINLAGQIIDGTINRQLKQLKDQVVYE